MLRRYRQSWPARITALGFIIVLIFGNIWLADALVAAVPPGWVVDGLLSGVLTAIGGGLGLAGMAVRERLTGGGHELDSGDDA